MIKSSWHQMEIRSSSSHFFSREHFSPLFREIFEQAPAHCNRSHRGIRLNQRALYSQGTTAWVKRKKISIPTANIKILGGGDYHQSRSVKTKVESVSTKVEGLARDRSTTDSTYCPERLYTTVHLCTWYLVVSINSLVSQCNIMLQHLALQTLQTIGISQRDAVQ